MKNSLALPAYESIEAPLPWWTDTALFFFTGASLVCLFGILNSIDQMAIARVVGIVGTTLVCWSVLTAIPNIHMRRLAYSQVLDIYSSTTLARAAEDEDSYSLETRQEISRYLRSRANARPPTEFN